MGALDLETGLPYSWNPTRDRGVGLFDYHVTAQGVWAGSDTDRWKGELRMKLAFFPWSGGKTVLGSQIGDLPADIYQLGRTTGSTGNDDQAVLYRVNAGGPALASADDGPDWAADTASTSSLRNSGSSTATAPSGLAVPQVDSAVPKGDMDRPPAHLWTTERWDPSSGDEMRWNFPVSQGTNITLRIYLANRCICTDGGNERVFDVEIDGVTRIDDLDLSKTVGHDVGTVRSFDLIADADGVDIDFIHGAADNPLVNGIEIIDNDVTASGTLGSQDEVRTLAWDGATDPIGASVSNTTVPWRTVRGAFMVNAGLFTFHADGTIMKRTFDGASFGAGSSIDGWSNNLIGEIPSMSGIFFDPATSSVYYTVAGENSLYRRSFVPESGILHAERSTVTAGNVGTLDPTRVAGMFLTGGRLYFVDENSGDLFGMNWTNGAPTGSATLEDSSADWRARALFVASVQPVNSPPDAVIATPSCVDNVCEFDGTGSTDDGTIVSHEWDFGDGGLGGSGAATSHTYSAAGTYTVTLTVTDDQGALDTAQVIVNPAASPNEPPTAVATGSCSANVCSFNGAGSSDTDGTIASYLWYFGDGTTATGPSPSHAYSAAGTYTVELSVTDDDGAVGSDQITVNPAAPPNLAPTAVATGSCSANVCSFNGAGSSDTDGTIVSYRWRFGDGTTATGPSPSHAYSAAGSYRVELSVTDDDGAVDSDQIIVNPAAPSNLAPTAVATGSCSANVCSFNGAGSSDTDGTIVSYRWRFGDGTTATGPSPSHTYDAVGTYKVELKVTDDDGATASDVISVSTSDALVPIVPARLLETRSGAGNQTVDDKFEGIGVRSGGSVTRLTVAGRGGVPADADGVMLNVTAIWPAAAGYVTVYPCGTQRPLASNVNYVAGQVVPNAVLAKVGTDGKVCIYTSAATHLVVDVNGFVPNGGSPDTIVPARLLETRSGAGNQTVDDKFEGIGVRSGGSVTRLTVAGRGGVPADADGVMLNVTAIWPAAAGYVTVYPCGTQRPLASNVNYVAGQVVPNAVLAKVGTDGKVCIYTSAATHLVVDVNGFVPNGGSPDTIVPARLLETRSGAGNQTVDDKFEGIGVRSGGSVTRLTVAGRGGVPADADGVMLNVTAIWPAAAGYVTVYPCGTQRPLASNVNYVAGQVVPNAVLAKVGTDGKVCIYTSAATHLVVDVNGSL